MFSKTDRRPRRVRSRALVAAVGGTAALLALSACTPASGSAADDKIGGTAALSVFAQQGTGQDLATNAFTKEVEKKFNIKFSWQTTTQDSSVAPEKRQILMASGDYPDAFLLIPWVDQFNQVDVEKLAKQGVALPLNDLIKQYAPDIQKALDSNPDYKAMATSPDGKIYGLPQLAETLHIQYPSKLWMNTEWLKKLGLQMPKTTDEMTKVLEAFKNGDPNGNGQKDEIPLSGDSHDTLIPFFMNAFIYDPQNPDKGNQSTTVLNKGKVDIQANKDGWREGLKYIKSLWDAGLIDKGAFTQNPAALAQEGNNAGPVLLGSASGLHPYIFVSPGAKDGRDKQYDAVPPLTGPDGADYATYAFGSTPGATFMLTNKASKNDQVAAIKLVNYLFTEKGQLDGNFGPEGKGWDKAPAGSEALNPDVKAQFVNLQLSQDEANAVQWGALSTYNQNAAFRESQAVPTDIYDTSGYERRLFQATQLYQGHEDKSQIYPSWKVWPDPAKATQVATQQTNIDNYVTQNALAFITGSKSLDSDWDSYVKGFDGLGLKDYLSTLQKAYDASKK
ncbi:ABC transporter substrate-binding protein [Leifsonia sp. 1010]|uniref:ABC transporter substrate-binding protein n=1 Tax=Leifsonia sp. 1010 TaxID=2817769 RepID=UPI002864E276|nr:ABC transporter substrate-binding protein [Leifsonia sp. 1010]MDR6612133.1 putative aldouronate transport system substrate-binding protein [Leifsonia sp. 1010]